MRLILNSCVRAALAICVVAGPAQATTWYVATTGNDANAGTVNSPLATPARALELAAPNDTILLRGGTYTITRSLQIQQAGLTIASYPGEWARVVGGTTDLRKLTSILIVYTSDVTVSRLELQGASYYGIKLDDLNGPSTGIRISGVYIHHTGRDGIKGQNADNVVIENSEIGFTGVRDSSNAEGIDLMGSIVATIRGNYVHDTATTGIYVKAGTQQATVEGNRVERTGHAGILLGSESAAAFMRNGVLPEAIDSVARNNLVVDTALAGLGSVAGDNVRFENNTVINAARSGQAAFRVAPNDYATPSRAVLLKNNIFVLDPASTRPMVQLYDYSDVLLSDHNIWYSAGGQYAFWREFSTGGSSYWSAFPAWQTGVNADWNSFAVDPLLSAGDLFKPLEGSPAVDAGEPLPDVTTDYSGTVRPKGAGYDIGAHEGITTVPAPPAPAAPQSLVATAVSRSRVDLSWFDSSSGEAGFRVERAPAGGGFVLIATLGPDVESFADTTVKPNKSYVYRLSAFNSAGASPYSNTATATTSR